MDVKKILLIEDEEDLLHLYQISLEKAGFRVFSSQNGFEGIRKAMEKKPDLILLDLMMPMGDGKDVLSMIRLHEEAKKIPVIIISNLNQGTIDLSGRDEQVMEYWIKADITPRRLVSRLNEYFT